MGNYYSTPKNVEQQLAEGVHPNEIFNGTYPVIFNFATKEQLETLLENGADINIVSNNKTPLMRAAYKDNFVQARLLLLYGACSNPLVPGTTNTALIVPWNTCMPPPVFSNEMALLLRIYGYGYPAGSDAWTDQKTKMMEQIQEQLKSIPGASLQQYPAGYSSFMRSDDQEALDRILNDSRMYDHISRNLDYNHAALLMVENGYSLNNED